MGAALVDTALEHARHGFRVQPAHGKRPLATAWPTVATDDPETIRNLFFAAPGADQISILTGRGLLVLDIDTRKGGDASLVTLCASHEPLPMTVTARTGSGGKHYYFQLPPGVEARNSADKLGTGLDIRGDGGQVIAPGSAHDTGGRYAWLDGLSPDEVAIAPCPAWLLALVVKAPPRPAAPAMRPAGTDRREAVYRASKYLARLDPAVEGSGGDHQTWLAALAVVRGFNLSETDAFDLLWNEYNPRCSPPWNERELRHKITSAANDSTATPGYLLDAPRPQREPLRVVRPGEQPRAQQGDAAPAAPGHVVGEQLATHWRTIDEHGPWLHEMPPRRRWLLRMPADSATGREERGLLPLGKVGMLVAGGGVGKTMALTQLALAVATGLPWLCGPAGEGGLLPPEGGGRVLLAMAEEDAQEMHRRLYSAHETMRRNAQLTDEESALAARRITVLALAGENVTLVQGGGQGYGREEIRPSSLAAEFVERLNTPDDPWSLIIMDPLSRFAGLDTETDNAAATRFVQVLETLTKAPGEPTVLVAHHTNKTARKEGTRDGTGARGSSALIDGVRWVAELVSEALSAEAPPGTPRTALLEVTKSNYSPLPDAPFRLVRGEHGELSMATKEVVAARAAAAPEPSVARRQKGTAEKRERVIQELQTWESISRNMLVANTGVSRDLVSGILESLVAEGKVRALGSKMEGYQWIR